MDAQAIRDKFYIGNEYNTFRSCSKGVKDENRTSAIDFTSNTEKAQIFFFTGKRV